MKRILTIFTLVTATIFTLDAQMFPLMEARKVLQNTRGFAVTGQVTQKEVDSNDSTCRLEVISFELPARRAKVFDKVVEEYNKESALSDGGHSFVADLGMPPAEREGIPGIKAVKFYYFQGRPYIRTGDGHNFVSVRKNLDNPAYRTASCIEWWPEDTLGVKDGKLLFGKVAGRVITVKGPIGESAYSRITSETPAQKADDAASFIAIEEIRELVRMYGLAVDPAHKAAIISSVNERIPVATSCLGKEGSVKRLSLLFNAIQKLGGYRTDILFEEDSSVEALQKRKLLGFDKYDVYGIAFYPRSDKYGEESKNGLFIWYARTHRLDASALPLKSPVLIRRPDNYDPNNWQTFPVYSGFSTVFFPNDLEGYNKYAIWCTKDSTYLVETILNRRGTYRQEKKDELHIQVCNSGKVYYPKSTWGIPLDTKYMISEHDNDNICLVTVFEALPPEAAKIDIVKGSRVIDSRNSVFNVPISELQNNQQYVIGKPWIINRPDKVRRYIVDGCVATCDEANAIKEIESIRLFPDGQLFIFSKQKGKVDTEPYYFVSYDENDKLTILLKMLPKGTDADASYTLEQIKKMLSVHDGVYGTNYDVIILEDDCRMGLLEELRKTLDKFSMRFAQSDREDMLSRNSSETNCPGHTLVEHTIHLDGQNHFILDGEDIVPRTLYRRMLNIVGEEGDKSLCLFKISCDPASSFNYYCQIIKNTARAEGELQAKVMYRYCQKNSKADPSYRDRISVALARMAPVRVVEDFCYDPAYNNKKNYFDVRAHHVGPLIIQIDGKQQPELTNLNDLFNYLDKHDLVMTEMDYYQNGTKLSDGTTFFDFTDSKPLELRITTTGR